MIEDRIESMSSEEGDHDEIPAIDTVKSMEADEDGNVFEPNFASNGYKAAVEQMEMQEKTQRKKSYSRWINTNLVGLKTFLFVFYGGVGVLSTWLNHSLLSKRFTEKETALVYGLASLLSIAMPFVFGLISDKSGQPKKVLAVSLLLAGLIYPLIVFVPTAVSYHYKEKHDWCRQTGRNESSCLPYLLNCSSSDAELIINYGTCSEGCGGKLILTKCKQQCQGRKFSKASANAGERNRSKIKAETDYSDTSGTVAALKSEAQRLPPSFQESLPDYDDGDADSEKGPPPHVCINSNAEKKYSKICKVYDEQMEHIIVEVNDITGYIDINGDGKCHYPVHGYLNGKDKPEALVRCPPLLGTNCFVTCSLQWDLDEVEQWVCRDDFLQWVVSFLLFLAVHTVGTMFMISAAALSNSAVLSMVHEHEHGKYLGFQLIFGAIGFALLTPLTALLFQYIESSRWETIPWELEYILGLPIWLIISAIAACTLSYNAEWVPKTGTIRPMLAKWAFPGQNLLFFEVLIILGCFQGMLDVLVYHQMKVLGGSLFVIAVGAAAAVGPAFLFIFRVERVIEYCGYHNILYTALVVLSLQFTGYAYLEDVSAEWSLLLKGLDTFSMLMVWVTASTHTHNSAPRSLVATCQAIVAVFYCCIGRGFGGVLIYFSLQYLSKENLMKTCSVVSILLCILFLCVHYCCFKSFPYKKKILVAKPTSQGATGNYKPLTSVRKEDKGPNDADEYY